MQQCKHDDTLHTLGGIYAVCRHVIDTTRLPSVIIDLGSRHGEGFEQLGCHYPHARYIFVEPTSQCAPYIADVIASHPDADCQFIRGVLGVERSKVNINIFPNDGDQSSNLYSDRGNVYGVPSIEVVDVLPYDTIELHDDDVVFAKVNIEGAEYELIESDFFRRIDHFVMEAHNGIIHGKTYVDIINALAPMYDLTTYGQKSYKYCFIVGHRRI